MLKKYFIPHEGNKHKPHLLRWEAVLGILTLALAVEMMFLLYVLYIFPGSSFLAAILAGVVVEETNASRNDYSLIPLAINPVLSTAAQAKADDMAKHGYFAHFGPDGKSPWAWMIEAGYSFDYAGENLAINFVDSEDVVGAWMHSPSHRENILNGEFTEIGLGIAMGMYKGSDTLFVVQMFGRPSFVPQSGASEGKPTSIFPEAEARDILSPKADEDVSPATSSSFAAFGQPEENAPVAGVASRVKSAYPPQLLRLLSNPAGVTNLFYLVLITLVSLALLLKIFVNFKVQHPGLMVNGVLMILILGGIVAMNQYIVLVAAKIL